MSSLVTSFDQLPDDVHFELFKYLRSYDKVRCERINSRWHQNLARVWAKQSSLVVIGKDSGKTRQRSVAAINGKDLRWGAGCNCHKLDHRFFVCDVIRLVGDELELQNSIMRSVLRRCKNLKAFWLRGRCPAGLGSLLNEFCPQLEHIEIGGIDNIKPENIEDIFEFKPVNLSCFLLNQNLKVALETIVCKFLDICEHLQTFTMPETSHPLIKTIINKPIRYLTVGEDDSDIFGPLVEQVAKKCPQLQKLSMDCEIQEDTLRCIVDSMVNLKELDIRLISDNQTRMLIPGHLAKLTKLEKLKLCLFFDYGNGEKWEPDDRYIIELIARVGGRLKKLYINTNDISFSAFTKIATESCPNLTELVFWNLSYMDLDFVSLPHLPILGSLKKLRKINLELNFKATQEERAANLKELLDNCTKLKYINFGDDFDVTNSVLMVLKHYAGKHPKRVIKFEALDDNYRPTSRVDLAPNVRFLNHRNTEFRSIPDDANLSRIYRYRRASISEVANLLGFEQLKT